jgi:uncharacterized lipoprotein YmbA
MKIASILLLISLAACSSQPVDTHYYLLRGDRVPETRPLVASPDFSLGKVTVAPYIDQPGMVLEVAVGQMRPALHHQWAEPMRESVRIFLQREISEQLGADLFSQAMSQADTAVDIRIDQLHGTYDGKVVLVAYWWLRRGDELLEPNQFGERQTLQSDGYQALVDAEKALLDKLASQIAGRLKELR